jgi:hypothetical protein
MLCKKIMQFLRTMVRTARAVPPGPYLPGRTSRAEPHGPYVTDRTSRAVRHRPYITGRTSRAVTDGPYLLLSAGRQGGGASRAVRGGALRAVRPIRGEDGRGLGHLGSSYPCHFTAYIHLLRQLLWFYWKPNQRWQKSFAEAYFALRAP